MQRSSQDIINQGVLEVCDRSLFDLSRDHRPTKNGPLDPRMGISGKTGFCETCDEPLQYCNGHFGYIKLALPVFHIGYLKAIIWMLQDICKVRLPSTSLDLSLEDFGSWPVMLISHSRNVRLCS